MRATLLTFGAIALSLTLGCDSTEEATPTDSGPIVRDVGFADTGSVDTGAQTDTGPVDTGAPTDTGAPDAGATGDTGAADAATADIPATDAPAVDVPSDSGPTDGGGSCVGDGGCYACAPANSGQFLNRCTSSACAPFNNAARLPLLRADGGLPPLP